MGQQEVREIGEGRALLAVIEQVSLVGINQYRKTTLISSEGGTCKHSNDLQAPLLKGSTKSCVFAYMVYICVCGWYVHTWYVCVHACGGPRPMLGIFLDSSPPYFF